MPLMFQSPVPLFLCLLLSALPSLFALVIGGKVYVAWKRKMLHDVIGGDQAYIHRKIDFWGHRILQLAKTTRG